MRSLVAILELLYRGHLELLLVTPKNYSMSGENREFEVWGIF